MKYKDEEIDKEDIESAVFTSNVISSYRKKSGKSQTEMAKELGIKQSRFSQMESGKMPINSVWLLKKVSKYMGIKISDLRPDLF